MEEIKYVSKNTMTYTAEKLKTIFGSRAVLDKIEKAFDDYVLNFDYSALAFNTDSIISGNSTSSVVGVGQVGVMMLGVS